MCYDKKEVANGVVSERQGLGSSEEDESRVDDVNANNVSRGQLQVHDVLQIPQQQPQGSMIRWERFLPVRSLKVLLVENDDSTRQVVSALLRNCSYEVVAVANGLQAWKILEDFNNHIDLVLTEVVMPVLSGVGLLCEIMNHITFKNIPVIMMSSHDSMGLVFKCLSKGAVDFLVKPIRKNELKNLWQHVWRRCHSSSGSGSESGTHTKKSVKSKSIDESENNTSSSDEHDNGSNGPSTGDGSDNGSGTQSSWTKKAAEIDSPQPMSPSYQLTDAPDSTCAQVIRTEPGTFSNRWMHVADTKDYQEQDEQLDNAEIGKDGVRVLKIPDFECEDQCENLSTPKSKKRQTKFPEGDNKLLDGEKLEHSNDNSTGKPRDRALSVLNQITKSAIPEYESKDIDTPNAASGILQIKDKACSDPGEMPSLELTLTRPRGTVDDRNAANDDRNVLRHSDLSAFSKYNTASSANQGPTGNIGSCSPLDNGSVAMKTDMMHNFPSHSNSTPLNQQSNGSSNNDMASTAKCVTPKSEAFSDKSESISAFKPFHSSAFQPVQTGCISSSQQFLTENASDVGVNTVQAQVRGSNKQVQLQVHHHHHHYHHHVHNMQQCQPQADHDDILLTKMAADARQCGSSNAFEGSMEENVVNYSVNGSVSGSNHGSNGQNRSGTVLNTEQQNMESDNMAGGNCGVGVISRKSSGSGADEDRVTQREAALIKFRQKRKERCFEKRVRYHSRKKLAEQRPRVRGQFVRRYDSKSGFDCPSSGVASEDNSCDSVR